MKVHISKLGLILTGLYIFFAVYIWLDSFSCNWNSGFCDLGLRAVSFPGSLVASLFVYPILQIAGHLKIATENYSLLYYIFYPAFILNIVIFYGLGMIISRAFTKSVAAKAGFPDNALLIDRNRNALKWLLLALLILTVAVVWMLLKY